MDTQASTLESLFRNAGGDQADALREMVRRHEARQVQAAPMPRELPPSANQPPQPIRRARVIAVTSGKGGVGKTNLAVNLAVRFAAAGKRVTLLDADMGLANADVLCGLDLRHNLAHVVARRKRLDEVIVDAPGGFKLVAGASGLATMADLPEAEHRRVVESLAGLEAENDLILIDTGAGISPNVLSFTRSADQTVVVATPEPTSITDAYATIKVVARSRPASDRRPISLVVNEVKSATEARAVYERVAKVAREFLGLTLGDAGFVPLDPAVPRAVRARVPFLIGEPRCAASVCVTRLAMRLEQGVFATPQMPDRGGFFGRLSGGLRG